jgi:hypoxanthine phosphoribosyltransferase
MVELQPGLKEILYTEEEIQKRVKEIAEEISRDFEGCEVVLIGVLNGAFIFLADLVRYMTIPLTIDFVACSSYGSSTVSGGNLSIIKDVSGVVQGKDILVIEDIVDTGLTLRELISFLHSKQPNSIHTVSLLDKPSRRKLLIETDYVGFSIDNDFVVGYGLDYNQQYRHLPYIALVSHDEE